jgi:hypothetical protein
MRDDGQNKHGWALPYPGACPQGQVGLHLATRYPIRTPCTISKRHPHHANADANLSKRQPSTLLAIFFFGTSLPQNKGGGVRWGRAAAAATKIRSCHSSRSEHQGKRNKCTYEVECVTDVPIGCIRPRKYMDL